MFDGIADTFLHDPVEVDFGELGHLRGGSAGLQLTRNAGALARLVKQIPEGGEQTFAVQIDGIEAPGKLARGIIGRADVSGDLGRGFGQRTGRRGELFGEHVAVHRGNRQFLANAVVQILPEPALLALADFEDFPLQAAAPLDFRFEGGYPFAST